MTAVDPKPGDWVLIRAKVIDRPIPEDVTVELFSRTDQYTARVRRDLCEITDKPIRDEPGNGAVVLLNGVAHQRIHDEWLAADGDASTGGASWVELNRLGDVVVILDA